MAGDEQDPFRPTWVGLLYRSASGTTVRTCSGQGLERYALARVLVVDDGHPIEWVEVGVPPGADIATIQALAEERARPRAAGSAAGAPEHGLSATVVVPTARRPRSVDACLARFATADGGRSVTEVLVVDNAPSEPATRGVTEAWAQRGLAVRWIPEPVRGASAARNRGLTEAATDYVAFVDDDVLVEPGWTEHILRGFSSSASIVTGFTAPAVIDTEAQSIFERKMRWSAIRRRECFSMARAATYDFPFPYMAGNFGSAANMAVRRADVVAIGGFDNRLGPGHRTRGGEDFEFFVRALRAGLDLAFEPTAIVSHVHRGDVPALRRQLFGYGVGMTAYLALLALRPGRVHMAREVLRAARTLLSSRAREVDEGIPRSFAAIELGGMLYGPLALILERGHGPALPRARRATG